MKKYVKSYREDCFKRYTKTLARVQRYPSKQLSSSFTNKTTIKHVFLESIRKLVTPRNSNNSILIYSTNKMKNLINLKLTVLLVQKVRNLSSKLI